MTTLKNQTAGSNTSPHYYVIIIIIIIIIIMLTFHDTLATYIILSKSIVKSGVWESVAEGQRGNIDQ